MEEEEDFTLWTKERRVVFNLRCLATCDNNIAFLATATTCPTYINTKCYLSESDATSHPLESGHAATRDLKIKLSYLGLEGSTGRPTKSICDYGDMIGLLKWHLGLPVMEEFPLADGAWAEQWQKLVSSVQAAHQRASYSLQCPYYAFEAYTQSLPPG